MNQTRSGLFNSSQKKLILAKVRIAKSFMAKLRGLMLSRESDFDFALVFEWDHLGQVDRSLHMMLVSYPIMALFLDEQKRVVDQTILNPWQFNYTPKKPCQSIIELPVAVGKKVQLGDQLTW